MAENRFLQGDLLDGDYFSGTIEVGGVEVPRTDIGRQYEEETGVRVLGSPGPLAVFGPRVGSGAGALLSGLSLRTRAVGATATDLVTNAGPLSGAVNAAAGNDSLGTADALGALQDGVTAALSPPDDPDDPGESRKLRLLVYAALFALFSWAVGQLLSFDFVIGDDGGSSA